jgi:hypothetical protein
MNRIAARCDQVRVAAPGPARRPSLWLLTSTPAWAVPRLSVPHAGARQVSRSTQHRGMPAVADQVPYPPARTPAVHLSGIVCACGHGAIALATQTPDQSLASRHPLTPVGPLSPPRGVPVRVPGQSSSPSRHASSQRIRVASVAIPSRIQRSRFNATRPAGRQPAHACRAEQGPCYNSASGIRFMMRVRRRGGGVQVGRQRVGIGRGGRFRRPQTPCVHASAEAVAPAALSPAQPLPRA